MVAYKIDKRFASKCGVRMLMSIFETGIRPGGHEGNRLDAYYHLFAPWDEPSRTSAEGNDLQAQRLSGSARSMTR